MERKVIHLHYNGDHYSVADEQGKIIASVPPDGNCLYTAVLYAVNGYNDQNHVYSLDEINNLRKLVYDHLLRQVNEDRTSGVENSIVGQFKEFFEDPENANGLLHGPLLDRAKAIVNEKNRQCMSVVENAKIALTRVSFKVKDSVEIEMCPKVKKKEGVVNGATNSVEFESSLLKGGSE